MYSPIFYNNVNMFLQYHIEWKLLSDIESQAKPLVSGMDKGYL